MDLSVSIFYAREAFLVGGFSYAAAADLRDREVTDVLWAFLGLGGLLLGFFVVSSGGTVPTALWLLVGLFVLQHLVPWDARLERRSTSLPGIVEVALYVGVTILIVATGWVYGIGARGLPVDVIAVYVSVLIARGLFEVRVLYGGADAKALMVAAMLLPFDPNPILTLPSSAGTILSVYPYSVTLLMNAAVFALAIPIVIALRNLRRGEFGFPRGFVGYTIPVSELPRRFVWLKDPTFGSGLDTDEAQVETSEEDHRLRERQRATLELQGVKRVWVTPQLPFLMLLAAGAITALLAGNLFFDLLAIL